MESIVLFTHTSWEEAPRIRHQVARLLRDFGYRVLFIERGDNVFKYRASQPREVEADIWVARPLRAVHHQLRVAPVLNHLEAFVVAPVVRSIVDQWACGVPDAIVNFAHDGWWLREAFPSTRLVTIIHDDFEAQSRLPFHGHITWTLKRTCMLSDDVFAVSVPLQHRLQQWCSAKLFLPWTIDRYVSPNTDMASKDILMFWGTVDNALDLAMIQQSFTAEAGSSIAICWSHSNRGRPKDDYCKSRFSDECGDSSASPAKCASYGPCACSDTSLSSNSSGQRCDVS